jgi:GH18 family chitinase/microcystin-dependent protein
MVNTLDFNLIDEDNQNAIYITDGTTPDRSFLEIINTCGKKLHIKPIEAGSGIIDFHFSLNFRPGTLTEKTISEASDRKMELVGVNVHQNMEIGHEQVTTWLTTGNGGINSICFRFEKGFTFSEEGKIVFILKNLVATARGGARGTRVELRYNQIYLKDSFPLSGSNLQYINIINRRGEKQIPLVTDFVGGNEVLNDGSVNNVVLSIRTAGNSKLSLSGGDKISGNPKETASCFKIFFDCTDGLDRKSWHLMKTSDASIVEIEDITNQADEKDTGRSKLQQKFNEKVTISYFPEWGVYRGFNPADIPADQLSIVLYAFLQLDNHYALGFADEWASLQRGFDYGDTEKGNLYNQIADSKTKQSGIMGQFQLLKKAHPDLRFQMSVGGWTLSSKFSQLANPKLRRNFIKSTKTFLNQYPVFSGIDIDWEFPGKYRKEVVERDPNQPKINMGNSVGCEPVSTTLVDEILALPAEKFENLETYVTHFDNLCTIGNYITINYKTYFIQEGHFKDVIKQSNEYKSLGDGDTPSHWSGKTFFKTPNGSGGQALYLREGDQIEGKKISFNLIDREVIYKKVRYYLDDQNRVYRSNDGDTYLSLMKELRECLGNSCLITSAVYTTREGINVVDYGKCQEYMDYIYLMSYDYVGPWGATTGHHTALYNSNPQRTDPSDCSIHDAVEEMALQGVSKKKIVLGAAAYGKSWGGVFCKGDQSPLYAEATKPDDLLAGPMTLEVGTLDYKDILKYEESGEFQLLWDDTAKASYLYNLKKGFFISYDSTRSVDEKTKYVLEQGLAGVMFWDMSTDDYSGNGLLQQVHNTFLEHPVQKKNLFSDDWYIDKYVQGKSAQWIVTSKHDKVAITGEVLKLSLTNIKTTFPNGLANIYIYYDNVPGYWDGIMINQLSKTPLIVRHAQTGVGIERPEAKLHIVEKEETYPKGVIVDTPGNFDAVPFRIRTGEGDLRDSDTKFLVRSNGNIEVSGAIALPAEGVDDLKHYIDASMPIGCIIMWSGTEEDIPAKWRLCDGQKYTLLGEATMNDPDPGSDFIMTPDLKGRFIVGAGTYWHQGGKQKYAKGTQGGRDRVLLEETHTPPHKHYKNTEVSWNRAEVTYQANSVIHYLYDSQNSMLSQTTGFNTTAKEVTSDKESWYAAEKSHENRPPYYALCYIMKVL